jgi:hypothetical protein
LNRLTATGIPLKKRPAEGRKLNPGLWGLVVLVPIVAHFYGLFHYGINIPKWDDHALRNFLVNFNVADSWGERFRLLFAQHNEHRIVYDRLVALLLYGLTGEINFVGLMAVGSLSLLGILLVFHRIIRVSGLAQAVFLPLPFLLLTFQHHENTLWGMASLQNFSVVFFTLSSLVCLAQGTKRLFGWAIFWALLALITSGNGTLIWFVGAGILVLQKEGRRLGIWATVAAGVLGFYFFDYQKPPGNPPGPVGNPMMYVRGFLTFAGSVADIQPQSPNRFTLPVLAGVVMVSLALFQGVRAVRRTTWFRGGAEAFDFFFLGVTGFVFATGLVVTVGRLGFGEWVLLTSRVKIYSVVWLMTLLVVAFREIRTLQTSLSWGLVLAGTVLFNGLTAFIEYPDVIIARHERMTWLYNWQHGHAGSGLPTYDRVRFPYRAPLIFSVFQPTTRAIPIDSLHQSANELVAENASHAGPVGASEGMFLLLESETGSYLFPTRPRRRAGFPSLLKGGSAFTNGFTAIINQNEAPAGTYRLEVVTLGNPSLRYPTGRMVSLKGTQSETLPKNW